MQLRGSRLAVKVTTSGKRAVATGAIELFGSETAPGLAMWALGLVWLALAWTGRLAPPGCRRHN